MKYDENVEVHYGIKLVDDRVIRKEAYYSQRNNFEFIRNLANHLIANPDPMVVPVYRFEVMEETPEKENRTWGSYKYAYEMMRLLMLTRAEKEIITTMIQKKYSDSQDHPVIQGARRDYPELHAFMSRVLSEGHYTDLHDQNFLKDEQGNYRIIDLEGFTRYPGIESR
jgi:hypothetical protein